MAGKRAGLKHSANGDDETTRSGLFMEAVRIIKEMRKATNGKYPKYAIWENVMGAFSSNSGDDFRVVLEELIKIVEPQVPEIPSPGKTGWSYADCIMGDGWSLAYRVFDAQYWPGTPQRRKRIYLVLDLTGERAEKILFERDGLRGHTEESGTPWKGTAGNPQGGSGADNSESSCLTPWDVQSRRIFTADGAWPALYGGEGGGHGYVFQTEPIAVATQQGGAEISESGICPTITAAAGMSGNNQPWICKTPAYGVTCKGNGDGFVSEERHTALSTGGGQPGQGFPCAMVPIAFTQNQRDELRDLGDKAGALQAELGMKQQTFIIDNIGGQAEYGVESQVNGTLRAGALGAVAYGMDVGFFNTFADVSPTMLARMYKDPHLVCYEKEPQYIVRRLTPTECARLQGFPDRWGDIPQKDTLTDEEYSFWLKVRNTHAAINGRATKEYTKDQILKWYNKLHSDSSEYKMWGNGIALPNALYVMQGIAEAINHARVDTNKGNGKDSRTA